MNQRIEGRFRPETSNTETGPLLIERRIAELFGQTYLNYYGDTGGMISSLRYGYFEARIEDNAAVSTEWYSYLSASLFAYRKWGKYEVRFHGDGQWTPDDLLPTAWQFSLGGPYSVRGYETSEFSGDSGFYLGLEGRRELYRPENALAAQRPDRRSLCRWRRLSLPRRWFRLAQGGFRKLGRGGSRTDRLRQPAEPVRRLCDAARRGARADPPRRSPASRLVHLQPAAVLTGRARRARPRAAAALARLQAGEFTTLFRPRIFAS